VEKCGRCHGDVRPKGGLKLTSRAGILQGGDNGPGAVSGKPDESLLVRPCATRTNPACRPRGSSPTAKLRFWSVG